MEPSEEFDVNLLDDLKPLESFLDVPELNDKFDETNDILQLEHAEDIVINENWIVQQRIREISPSGEPTALTASGMRTAVGMRDGSCLIFNEEYVLDVRIETANVGAVTALGLSLDGKRILIGFARGKVMMYDTGHPKAPIRKLPYNCHAISTAAVNLVRFLTISNSIGVCSDSSSVTGLEFTRVMARRGTELYPIYRGEMVQTPNIFMASSLLSSKSESHPLSDHPLCSIITPQKFIIKNLTKNELKEAELSFPHCTTSSAALSSSWLMNAKLEVIVALAHGQQITCFRFDQCTQWVVDRVVQLDEIASFVMTFPSTNLLLCASSPDCTPPFQLELVDIESCRVIDTRNAAEGEQFNTKLSPLRTHNEIVYLNTSGILKSKRIANWTERIDRVKQSYGIKESIKLVINFYRNELVGIIKLGDTDYERRTNARLAFHRLMPRYLKNQLTEDQTNYAYVADFTISACIAMELSEALWMPNDGHPPFMDHFARLNNRSRVAFYNRIQKHIIADELFDISPILLSPLLTHQAESGHISLLPSLISKVSMSSIDINLALNLFWSYDLWDGIIMIYNHVLNDYRTPLEKLIQQIDQNQSVGDTLLMYLSCSLDGVRYPNGEALGDKAEVVRQEILGIICCEYVSNEQNFPILRKLLSRNPQGTLDLMNLTLHKSPKESVQRLIEILFKLAFIMGPSCRGLILLFIGRQLVRDDTIHIDKLQTDQILEFLVNPNAERATEREQICQQMLEHSRLAQVSSSRLQVLVKKAKFYNLAFDIAIKNEDYVTALKCLYDQGDYQRTMNFISSHLACNPSEMFMEKVLALFPALIEYDLPKCLTLCLEYYTHALIDVINMLNDDLKYTFYQEMFLLDRGQPRNSDHFKNYVTMLLNLEPTKLADILSETDFDVDIIKPLLEKENHPAARAVLLERSGDYKEASTILLQCLQESDEHQEEKLKSFLSFATRIADNLNQAQREELFLPLFDIVSSFPLSEMRILLPKALVGLIGRVPMIKAVNAFLKFFNSSACEGAQFGEMKYLLNAVLDATTQEAHNLKQLISISRTGKLSLQSQLRERKTMAAVAGIPGAMCNLTGKQLGHQPRVVFFDESAEYNINAIAADPDHEPSSCVQGQKHRQLFQERGLHYSLPMDGDMEDWSNIQNIHNFVSYKFGSCLS